LRIDSGIIRFGRAAHQLDSAAMTLAIKEFEPNSARNPTTIPNAGPTISALTTNGRRQTQPGTPTTSVP
jgi:hypothetical protein